MPNLELTHLDKIFFPKHGYTKGDMVDYYRSRRSSMLTKAAPTPPISYSKTLPAPTTTRWLSPAAPSMPIICAWTNAPGSL